MHFVECFFTYAFFFLHEDIHFVRCRTMLSVCERLWAYGQIPMMQHDTNRALMLQDDTDGAGVEAIITAYASLWRIRASLR